MTDTNKSSQSSKSQNLIFNLRYEIALLFTFILLLAIIAEKAFILEDAYINFINIRNFNDGFFYSAIPDVRTQSATSNFWTLILLFGSFFTHNLENLTIYISFIFTIIAIFIFISYFSLYKEKWLSVFLLFLLATSTSFTDYSTSGLENPLAHAILALIFVIILSKKWDNVNIPFLSFTSSLLVMNRYDHILLVVPALLFVFLNRKMYLADTKKILMGFLPLWIWFIFSWFYFGSIFPDTYYAKLGTGIPVYDRIHLAVMHHLRLLDLDPVGSYAMIAVILLTCLTFFSSTYKFFIKRKSIDEQNIKILSIGLGIVLYNLYFFYAGGDYMVGRFMSAPIFLSIFLLLLYANNRFQSRANSSHKFIFILIIISLALIIKAYGVNMFVPRYSTNSPDGLIRALTFDMRKFPQNWYFISQDHHTKDWRQLGLKRAIDADKAVFPSVVEHMAAGIIPYYAGPRSRLIDVFAITDPLLCHLPCSVTSAAAHSMRIVPKGYAYFIQTGDLSKMEPDIASYTQTIYLIKTMPLFNMERIKLLTLFTFGKYQPILESYISRHTKDYYKPGDATVLFHNAYQETILKDFFLPIDKNFKHPLGW